MFKQITILGAGFMGASFAGAYKKVFPGTRIIAFSRSPASLRKTGKCPYFDETTLDLEKALRGSQAVVCAMPVEAIVDYFKKIAPFIEPGTTVFDMGSTKEKIHATAKKNLPRACFVGCHPLCGSEKSGSRHADPVLFEKAICIVTSPRAQKSARLVSRMWQALGMKIHWMSPPVHDDIMAAVSHLPHVLSFVLAGATPSSALRFAPSSFRDMTRIGLSPEHVWTDIFISNKKYLGRVLKQYRRELERFSVCLAKNDRPGMKKIIERSNKAFASLDKKR